MKIGLLFSGGTDSTLAALLLDRFYDVTLVTVHFGVTDDWERAQAVATVIDLPFIDIEVDRSIAEDALGVVLNDGRARRGIDQLHLAALEALAEKEFDAIADGTRRDDRVPSVSRAKAQQLERAYGVDYVSPLSGFGRRAVDRLVDEYLEVEVGPAADIDRPDYETVLRELCSNRSDLPAADSLFPSRTQTAVIGLR